MSTSPGQQSAPAEANCTIESECHVSRRNIDRNLSVPTPTSTPSSPILLPPQTPQTPTVIPSFRPLVAGHPIDRNDSPENIKKLNWGGANLRTPSRYIRGNKFQLHDAFRCPYTENELEDIREALEEDPYIGFSSAKELTQTAPGAWQYIPSKTVNRMPSSGNDQHHELPNSLQFHLPSLSPQLPSSPIPEQKHKSPALMKGTAHGYDLIKPTNSVHGTPQHYRVLSSTGAEKLEPPSTRLKRKTAECTAATEQAAVKEAELAATEAALRQSLEAVQADRRVSKKLESCTVQEQQGTKASKREAKSESKSLGDVSCSEIFTSFIHNMHLLLNRRRNGRKQMKKLY